MEEAHGVNLNVGRDEGENKVTVLGVCVLLVRSKARLWDNGSRKETRAGARNQYLPERALSI